MDANGSGEATAAALVSGIVAATAVAVVAAAIAVFRRGGAATAASDVPGAPEGPGAPAVSTGAKQKKRKKKRPAAKAKVPFCQACQKELQPEFLEGHLQGKKHKANAAEAGIQGDDCFVFVKPAGDDAGWSKGGKSKAKKRRSAKYKSDFELREGGVNVVDGLRLYEDVIPAHEEAELIRYVDDLIEEGRRGHLGGLTFMPGIAAGYWKSRDKAQGRTVIQYGVVYDYANHRIGVEDYCDPIPDRINALITKLVTKGVLPADKRPDSVIINVYGKGDCIPPHVDHEDYERPFCTLSLLSEAPMLLGTHIKTLQPGVFRAPFSIALPRRSVLVLRGNGANLAKHCIPACPAKRISITLRRCPPDVRRLLGIEDPAT